jgi:hypothetical protein
MSKKVDIGTLSSMLTNVVPDEDTVIPSIEDEEVKLEDEQEEETLEEESTEETEDVIDEVTEEDEEDLPDDVIEEEEKADTENTDPVDIDNLDEYEASIASYVEEKLYEKLGWSLEEEDKRAESIDSIVELLESVVEENSKPIYANDEIEQLNDFVTNGGNLKDYFDSRYSSELDLETVDLNRQANQERILREYYKSQGISDDRIEKRIQRYDDTGVLEDEATDALDLLKDVKAKESQKLLSEQENKRKEQEKTQQKFYDNVTSYIRSSKNIDGISLSKTEREQLIKNIFQVNKEGKTLYQKMYEDNSISNLVSSAFDVTMKDKKKKRTKKQISSSAAKELREKLQSSKRNPRMQGSGRTPSSDSPLTGLAKALAGN